MTQQTAETARHLTSRAEIRRVVAVVNPASGGVEPGAAAALKTLLDEFGLDSQVIVLPAEEIADALHAAIDTGPDLVIVLAGDGTACLAADLCGPDGPLLAPLPGGTMNMLPFALYGARPWRECLIAALCDGQERPVSGGEVGGHRFYCAAIIGSPALWGPAREAIRLGQFRAAWSHAVYAFRRAFTSRLRFDLGGRRRQKTVALGLICPLVSRAMNSDHALEAVILDVQDAAQAFHLGLTNLFHDWRQDPAVTVESCVQGRVWAQRPIPCLIDGEMHRLGRAVDFRFLPMAFRALAPQAENWPIAP